VTASRSERGAAGVRKRDPLLGLRAAELSEKLFCDKLVTAVRRRSAMAKSGGGGGGGNAQQ